uniref:SHSP domain-containing protein n=1 Tax=Rhabditophanes sp. KR3021 TaxID=114890 RepID=A0AC35TPU9_9BILA
MNFAPKSYLFAKNNIGQITDDSEANTFAIDWPNNEDVIVCEGNRKNFKIALNCRQFEKNEVSVAVRGNNLDIRAHHEGKRGSDHCGRDISKSYKLPSNVNPNSVKHSFGPDGELIITAERSYK